MESIHMDPTATHQPQNPALDAAIASYLQAVERGEQPDRAKLLSEHVTVAEDLRRFFHDQDQIDRLTQPASTRPGPNSLLGSYRIVREIGRGGMGIVYEAIHEQLKKRVALKLLPVSPLTQASHLERFLREAQTAASLHHTNIVPVFDVGQLDGTPYYAMQFIEGKTLDRLFPARGNEEGNDVWSPSPSRGEGLGVRGSESSVLAPDSKRVQHKNKPLTPGPSPREGEGRKSHYSHIADLGRQAAAALAYAHQRGVIHRDIKPSNLILETQNTLWITDFGLAKRFAIDETEANLTQSGQVIGTPRYMSPEQAAAGANPIDHRTDIYSLGATLYELLAGHPAFDGTTPPEVVQQILTREALPLRRHDTAIPRDLETVVIKAMAKRPADRYASAQELADDLGRYLAGEPVQARRIGVLGRTWRWAKREPRVAGLVGAVVGSLVLGLAGTGWFAARMDSFANQLETQKNELLNSLIVSSPLRANIHGSNTNDNSIDFRSLLWITEPIPYLQEMRMDASSSMYMAVRRVSNWIRYYSVYGTVYQDTGCYSDYPSLTNFDETTRIGTTEDGRYSEFLVKTDGGRTLDCISLDFRSGIMQRRNNADGSKTNRGMTAALRSDLLEHAYWDQVVTDGGYSIAVSRNGIPESPRIYLSNNNCYYTQFSSDKDGSYLIASTNKHISDLEKMEMKGVPYTIAIWPLYPLCHAQARDLLDYSQLLACHRLDRGRYVSLTIDEARAGWQTLQARYPDVFTIPIDDCLAWHLKEDAASVRTKHQHAALFAANFDCRDRPNEPHHFVARGRLFTVLGDHDKASADFAMAWKLGGTGWVKSECRRMVRDAWRSLQTSLLTPSSSPSGGEGIQTARGGEGKQTGELQAYYRKLQIAATYLEQDPRTMCALLLGKPPLHRLALAMAKQRLGIELDERDQAAMASVLR